MIINSSAAAAITSLNSNQAALDRTYYRNDSTAETTTPKVNSGETSSAAGQGISENSQTPVASSAMLDTDAAWQTATFAMNSILSNPGMAVLAQASQLNPAALSILE